MTQTIHAVYENGVFRPIEKVDLPVRTPLDPKSVSARCDWRNQSRRLQATTFSRLQHVCIR